MTAAERNALLVALEVMDISEVHDFLQELSTLAIAQYTAWMNKVASGEKVMKKYAAAARACGIVLSNIAYAVETRDRYGSKGKISGYMLAALFQHATNGGVDVFKLADKYMPNWHAKLVGARVSGKLDDGKTYGYYQPRWDTVNGYNQIMERVKTAA